jgi:hypothetical protein
MALKSHKARDLDLRSVWLLDNQSTFDLCCNPDFAHKRQDAKRAMHMSSNGGGLRISKECKVSGYDFWTWFTKRAMTNILCLKNLIHLYRVTYDSERQTAFIVHREEFGLPNTVFDMHPCGLHVLSDPVREAKVKEDVKQAFLAYLFFINSNDKKHSQLKKTVANDRAKGDGEAFPSMQLLRS